MAQLENENKKMKEAANAMAVDITNLRTTTVFMCSSMEAHNNELKSLKEEVTNLKCPNIRLEAYSRRENVKIFGIKESVGESNDKTEELVCKMMHDKMKIPKENFETFRFERVHQIPSRGNGLQPSKPRPIIAKFSFYQDKEYVWSFVKNLKGTKIGIANDYPREIDKIHQTLYPVFKKAKQAKQKAFFKVDKLIVSGQVYRGVETNNLAHYGLIMNSDFIMNNNSATGGSQPQSTPQ